MEKESASTKRRQDVPSSNSFLKLFPLTGLCMLLGISSLCTKFCLSMIVSENNAFHITE